MIGAADAPTEFSDARRLAWLRLWRSENIGPRTFANLLARFGTAEAALDALPDLVRAAKPGRAVRIAAVADVEREMEVAARLNARFIAMAEPTYPQRLLQIDSPPAVIAVRGNPDCLNRPAVGIVGARNASAAGLAFTERLARGMGQAGYVVVSGFARGTDSRAHRASLATGTVAVLAGGHDKLYPADQGLLLDLLLEEGAAISEMPFGWEARGRDFPRRNRLVSGLSLGVVVVEAARRSGSLITARFAADQGREVFAVPGSPLDPRTEGTNDLLRDGATFCCEVDDVLRALADRGMERGQGDLFADGAARDEEPLWDELDLSDGRAAATSAREPRSAPVMYEAAAEPVASGMEEADAGSPLDRLVAKLGPAPISIDELGRAADLTARDVRAALFELELAGRLERHGGGLVSLVTP